MKIQVLIETPPPARSKYPSRREATGSVEEQIREAIECVESGKDSHVEWKFLNKAYAALQKKEKSKRVKNLVSMIEPVLSKYGQHGIAEKDQ